MSSFDNNSSVIKTLCVGNVYSGKTSIVKRYVRNTFNNNYCTTIGVDFILKNMVVNGSNVKVQIWDLAGQDRFTGLARSFYTHALGAIVVFDLMDRNSFESTQKWKKDIDEKIELPNGHKLPVLLLGNKCDLVSRESPAVVSEDTIAQAVEKHGFFKYYPTSALDGTNIHEAIDALVEEIVRRAALPNVEGYNADNNTSQYRPTNTVDINKQQSQQQTESSGGCC